MNESQALQAPQIRQRSLTVVDLRRSERWFREAFSLRPAGGRRTREAVCWWLVNGAPAARLELRQAALPLSPLMAASDVEPLTVAVWDFDAALARLAVLGTPATARGHVPSRCASTCSPDGLRVELVEELQAITLRLDPHWEPVADVDARAAAKGQRPATDTHTVRLQVLLNASPERAWEHIADHAGMAAWLGVQQATLSRAGSPDRNGLGAERTLVDAVIGTVVEQVVDWQPGCSYRYRIVAGSPFRYHLGELRLRPQGAQTELLVTIRFRPRWPGTGGVLKLVLGFKLRAALGKLKALIEAH